MTPFLKQFWNIKGKITHVYFDAYLGFLNRNLSKVKIDFKLIELYQSRAKFEISSARHLSPIIETTIRDQHDHRERLMLR